jgi:hypothetical protein
MRREMKRIFEVKIECNYDDLDTVIIELDQKVIDVVDNEWRSMFYPLFTPEDIAEHIAYNLVVNKAKLTYLDGWANLSDDMAKIIKYSEEPEWNFTAKEIGGEK